ncbi:MAG: FeoA family protein [Gammaproteobacteria bacterium]|mgnify:CR=1 FL=1|jgi:ferrous iron transport protein A|nr:iron transporter [Gammaproteobacteria bacterium]MDP6095781.1 FeoA family protein [Gammaproteobacteria bacterium]HJO12414.1 FeoA family protein [Gammaproteobacteria bacterium]|tara:strand:- start:351 stop:587 length:237 start_codon:yes stop_codon:yes gene_type:complete
MTKTALSEAKNGDRCMVLDVASKPAELKSRLYALGIIPGVTVHILRFAPLGDPMQLKVSGCFISIRRAEADIIAVEIQ